MASITLGCRCPTLATLMPPIKSMYCFPSAPYKVQQSAFTISNASGAEEVWATWRRKSSRWFKWINFKQRTQRWRKDANKLAKLPYYLTPVKFCFLEFSYLLFSRRGLRVSDIWSSTRVRCCWVMISCWSVALILSSVARTMSWKAKAGNNTIINFQLLILNYSCL